MGKKKNETHKKKHQLRHHSYKEARMLLRIDHLCEVCTARLSSSHPAKPQVDELKVAVAVEADVVRLQVAVDHHFPRHGVVVHVLQGLRQLQPLLQQLFIPISYSNHKKKNERASD